MKTGIIGLPQVGRHRWFRILTKAHLSDSARANPREAHIGVAKVPDDRLDRLAALYQPEEAYAHLCRICRRWRDRPGSAERQRLRGASAQRGRTGSRGAGV